MIKTGYFGCANKYKNCICVSICAKPPKNYRGLRYDKLAPSYGILTDYHKSGNSEEFTERYNRDILGDKNIHYVLQELYMLLPMNIKSILMRSEDAWYNNKNFDIVLLCYEKPDEFCHRHLVAEWFNRNGIYVVEKTI